MHRDSCRDALRDLARIAEPGDERLGRLVNSVGAESVMRAVESNDTEGMPGEHSRRFEFGGLRERWMRCRDIDPEIQASRVGARIVTRCDADWPTQLSDLGDREPFALWVIGAGSLRLLALRSVAVIGARACTPYGSDIARRWGGLLAEAGWVVVSGGASGIDGAAHRGALEAGGVTLAVMPGGVDVVYPREHEMLFSKIADDGLLISEVPPGDNVRRQRFLARNRLIASLTRGTVVVEAALRSGTTATARHANDIHRPVLAIPGSVHSPASAGCHRMIRDREALIALDVDDILSVIDPDRSLGMLAPDPARRDRDSLDARSARVLDALPARRSANLDAIVPASGLDRRSVLAALGVLEVDGWVTRSPQGWCIARRD